MSEIQTIVMPKWGLAMQEGMLAAWHVEEGEHSFLHREAPFGHHDRLDL